MQERNGEGLVVGQDEIDSGEVKGLELGGLRGWLDGGSRGEGVSDEHSGAWGVPGM